ncbi:Signal peptide peptidase-like 2 [Tetrabaena socialis]|uniref:Signal peptide peptidase-like 2 n=1 Tax=Tetrabaena socialis TaxID=47790 RepID=A0A2J7ZP93_9CHLO|nr:Signal peptide peptidase-like 2 [Tetrabaena socialis]|eukprot:PNH02072.1 Signal peptide peptidase-like 2 [Tetrabaena socialis]
MAPMPVFLDVGQLSRITNFIGLGGQPKAQQPVATYAMLWPARRVPQAEVVAVAARDGIRARKYAKQHGIPRSWGSYEALLADPEVDAVYVGLPNGLHGQWATAALRAGKHVLCEKPFAANEQEARQPAPAAPKPAAAAAATAAAAPPAAGGGGASRRAAVVGPQQRGAGGIAVDRLEALVAVQTVADVAEMPRNRQQINRPARVVAVVEMGFGLEQVDLRQILVVNALKGIIRRLNIVVVQLGHSRRARGGGSLGHEGKTRALLLAAAQLAQVARARDECYGPLVKLSVAARSESGSAQRPLLRTRPTPAARWRQRHQGLLAGPAKAAAPAHEVVDLTPRAAVAFVAVASAMLLLLYFLLSKIFFYVLLVLFCIASVQSQTVLYAAGLAALLPRARRTAEVQVPWLGPCPLAAVLTLPLAAAVAVVWAVGRNADWSWELQDLQGVALMLLVLRTLRVPSLKVACILLPGCLAYDVFWVFIQPMLFGGGESVMVHAFRRVFLFVVVSARLEVQLIRWLPS